MQTVCTNSLRLLACSRSSSAAIIRPTSRALSGTAVHYDGQGFGERVSFDNAEKSRVFASFFDAGLPMWQSMLDLALVEAVVPSPGGNILDLGAGPGEPSCHFAAAYPEATVTCTDLAPPMVELAKGRVQAKGMSSDRVRCMVLDMENQAAIGSSTQDLVISQMAYMFCPDKDQALKETFRVLKPGGVLIANVWTDFDLVRVAGALAGSVMGGPPPDGTPAINPVGPMSLADAEPWDAMLDAAGFVPTASHNFAAEVKFDTGEAGTEQSFKVCSLPIWDKLTELEETGEDSEAWSKAAEAFAEISKPYTEQDGHVYVNGAYRISVVKKPE